MPLRLLQDRPKLRLLEDMEELKPSLFRLPEIETEIRTARPGEIPYKPSLTARDKAAAVADLIYRERGEQVPRGLRLLRKIGGRKAEAITEIALFPHWTAIKVARGVAGAVEPNISMWNMIVDSAKKGVLEPEKVEPTSVAILKAYPKTDWRVAGSVGALVEIGMFMPGMLGKLTKSVGKEAQFSKALNDLRKTSRWSKTVQGISKAKNVPVNEVDSQLARVLWNNRNKANYFRIINKNIKTRTGIDIYSRAGELPIKRPGIKPKVTPTEIKPSLLKPPPRKFPEKLLEKGVKIVAREAPIRMDKDVSVKDIYGKKVTLPAGEEYTPFKLSNNQVLLHDGKDVVVNKSQLENVEQQGIVLGEKPGLVPEDIKVVEKSEKATVAFDEYNKYAESLVTKYSQQYPGYNLNNLSQEGILSNQEKARLDELDNEVRTHRKESTKFFRYQLPGGENYREVLLTAPFKRKQPFDEFRQQYYKRFPKSDLTANEVRDIYNKSTAVIPEEGKLTGKQAPEAFKSSHWDEPNVLAHARLNDRTTPDGKKVLFVEELQSDWARTVRKKGAIVSTEGWKAIRNTSPALSSNLWFVEDAQGNRTGTTNADTEAEAISNVATKEGKLIPSHPLLKNWQELAVKQVLDIAVKEGYDAISWTTGQQQADRYDLSKQVSQVEYNTNTNTLFAIDKYGQLKLQKDIPIGEAEKYIGKIPAQRLIDTKPDKNGQKIISGQDLKIGAEWAKSLYDVQIPSILTKLTKKWGGEVEKGKLIEKTKFRDKQFFVAKNDGSAIEFNTKEEAKKWLKANPKEKELGVSLEGQIGENKPLPNLSPTQQSLTITPQIKEMVLTGGQPKAGGKIHKRKEEPLIQEAKKFKTAEEFVKAQVPKVNWKIEKQKPFEFCQDCTLEGSGESISEMVETSQDISYNEFVKVLGKEKLQELFGHYAWGKEKGLKLKDDYAVSFSRGIFKGQPAYYITQSGIEYVFVNPTKLSVSKLSEQQLTALWQQAQEKLPVLPKKKIEPSLISSEQLTPEIMDSLVVSEKQLATKRVLENKSIKRTAKEMGITPDDVIKDELFLAQRIQKIPEEIAAAKVKSEEELAEAFEAEYGKEVAGTRNSLRSFLEGKLKPELKGLGEYADIKHLNWLFAKEGEIGYTPDELVGELQGMGFDVESDESVRELISEYFKEYIEVKTAKSVAAIERQAQARLKRGLKPKGTTQKIQEEMRLGKLRVIAEQLIKVADVAPRVITPKQIAYVNVLKDKNLLSDRQFNRLKKIFTGKKSLKVTTPTGRMKKAPVTKEEAVKFAKGIEKVVPRKPIITGQPPVIPTGKALVPSEWRQPYNDLTIFQAAPLSGLDPIRAAEIVDGKSYGVVRRYVVEPVREAERQHKLELKKILDELTKISKGMQSKSKNSELTFRYIEKTLEIPETELPDTVQKTAKYMQKHYEDFLIRINEKRALLRKVPIQKRKDYITHIQELSLLDEFFQGMTNIPDDVVNIPSFSKSNSPFFRFALQRLGGKAFRLDAISAFETYVSKALPVIHNTDALKSARPLVDRLPHNAYKYFTQYLDETMALKPAQADKLVPKPLLKGVSWLRGKMGKGAILGNVASVFNQLFTIPNVVSVSPKYAASVALKMHRPAFRAFTEKYSKVLQGRIYEIDFDPTLLSKTENALGFFIQMMDKEMVRFAFGVGLEKALSQGVPMEEALRMADDTAFKTQSGFNVADLPPAFRSKFAGSFLQFQNTVNNGLNFLKYDLGKEKDIRGKWGIFKAGIIWMATLWIMNRTYRAFGIPTPIEKWSDIFPLLSMAEYGPPVTYSVPTAILSLSLARTPQDRKRARRSLRRAIFLFLPAGNQIRKTLEGIYWASEGGKFDKKGRLQFPIRGGPEVIRSIVFGPYGTKEGRRYIRRGFKKEKKSKLRLLK